MVCTRPASTSPFCSTRTAWPHAGAFFLDQRGEHAGEGGRHPRLRQQPFLLRDLLLQDRLLQVGGVDAAAGGAAGVLDQLVLLAQLDLVALDVQFRGQQVFAGDDAGAAQLLVALVLDARGLQVDLQQFDGAGGLLELLLHLEPQHDDPVLLLRQLFLQRFERQADLAVVQFEQQVALFHLLAGLGVDPRDPRRAGAGDHFLVHGDDHAGGVDGVADVAAPHLGHDDVGRGHARAHDAVDAPGGGAKARQQEDGCRDAQLAPAAQEIGVECLVHGC
jgi:hypothetical protein